MLANWQRYYQRAVTTVGKGGRWGEGQLGASEGITDSLQSE